MPDFRSLISRMADELDHYRQLLMDDRRETHALAVEARAADLLERLSPAQPVPVSERLPKEPLAWWFTPESDEEYGWWVLEPDGMEREPQPTHWLPANALPLPQPS